MNLALAEIALPLRLRLERPLSDEQLMRFSSANELIRVERDANGELILTSASGLEGSGWNSDVLTDLTNWARQDGRGKVFDSNGGFTLPDGSMRAPDAAWVSWERWNALPKKEQKRYGRLVPEFVIELRSESDRLAPLKAKMQTWIGNGVELAWLIDPQNERVTIYRSEEAPEVHEHPSSVQGTGPVRGFDLVMSRIWS